MLKNKVNFKGSNRFEKMVSYARSEQITGAAMTQHAERNMRESLKQRIVCIKYCLTFSRIKLMMDELFAWFDMFYILF